MYNSRNFIVSSLITENDSMNILDYEYLYNGGGAAIADFNNDGKQDIFFTGNMVGNKMYLKNASNFSIENALIQPRAEAEIAFILKEDIQGPGITKEDVISATEKIVPCFEIVDSRIDNWKIKIQDTIADNASCGIFVLGEGACAPDKFSMDELEVVVNKNGEFLSSGFGSAVQGHPAEAVAWLANTLGEYEIPLLKGEFILSGSLVPLEPAKTGDKFSMELKGVGTCEINFI